MTTNGLDYNTERGRLLMREYGRQVQDMVQYALQLTDRDERQHCAETIVECMRRLSPRNKRSEAEYEQTLWSHLALMSNFQLDIDYPVKIVDENQWSSRPDPIAYPKHDVPVRHYGSLIFQLLEQLKTMPDGKEREELFRTTVAQMRRSLQQWTSGSTSNEKIIADIDRFTDGELHEAAEQYLQVRTRVDRTKTKKP